MSTAVTLKRTGDKMPLVTKETCADTVYNAIKEGYRLFDGASDYGNEKQAGEGVARAIKDGLVKREDLWITSKVEAAVKYSLALWGLDYFDLYLVHFPISIEYIEPSVKFPPEWWGLDGKIHPVNVPFQETWVEMEKLADKGLAKNIGLSNAQGSFIYDVLRYARIEPQVLQVEIHPYLTQEPLIAFCKTLGIAITAYSSFGPQGYVEIDAHKGAKGLFEHDAVASIASKKGKTPAQILLRWALQQGLAVIPKSNNHERLVQNLEATSFELTSEEVKSISALNIGLRLNDPVDLDTRLAIFA
ncbi:hypothetical protein TRAPUB_927 [Trametes pubescens]|uniref:NADP-dependent oxidoreductase domain-containing protein n=1 Tax=Trametes pubescens TaxID=154538 RepID=A0A1M2VKN6_TRAPU|nr:hypothetical protein TRAPUB_927 [Trametes pubescens]